MTVKVIGRVVLSMSLIVTAIMCYLLAATGQDFGEEPAKPKNGDHRTPAPLSCSISSNKKFYKMGEVPKIQVRIKNEQDKAIYLVGSLDGSEDRMRHPHCYFEIKNSQGQLIRKPRYLRCGNTNPLRPSDFIKVEPKAVFNPHMQIDEYGFSGSHVLALTKDIFSKPAEYRLRFIYSTENPDIKQWLGDGRWGWNSQQDIKLIERFKQVPQLTVQSNELVIRFVK